jgi:hypothetical protein
MEQHAGLTYACYFLLGSGILAPWNAFITGDPNLQLTVVSSGLASLPMSRLPLLLSCCSWRFRWQRAVTVSLTHLCLTAAASAHAHHQFSSLLQLRITLKQCSQAVTWTGCSLWRIYQCAC